MPSSPTANRGRRMPMLSPTTSLYAGSGFLGYSQGMNLPRPTTPTRSSSSTGLLESTLTMTPLAKRNVPATPTRSPGKRKVSRTVEEDIFGESIRPLSLMNPPKTPSRRPAEASNSCAPETPRKAVSPFGTYSPFRTPRRIVFDPSDPGTMLEEELTALASGRHQIPNDSPAGLFSRLKGFLYDSPNIPSPDKWKPW